MMIVSITYRRYPVGHEQNVIPFLRINPGLRQFEIKVHIVLRMYNTTLVIRRGNQRLFFWLLDFFLKAREFFPSRARSRATASALDISE
ncbi:MAG: hypothetical protein NUV60_02305 [Patescibacteria group bacterium]|nr:hypothetical protein [Patescibacteria group bacterium]